MSASDGADPDGARRRLLIGAVAVGGAAAAGGIATAAAAPGPSGAEIAFRRAFAPTPEGGIDVAARLGFLAADAGVVDHDVPFPMDADGYADHLRFQAAQWQKVEWSIHDLRTVPHGGAAIVSCFYNERGKPKDAGFRLRAGFCTAVCVETPAGWRALALHMAPLLAQVLDASPS